MNGVACSLMIKYSTATAKNPFVWFNGKGFSQRRKGAEKKELKVNS